MWSGIKTKFEKLKIYALNLKNGRLKVMLMYFSLLKQDFLNIREVITHNFLKIANKTGTRLKL